MKKKEQYGNEKKKWKKIHLICFRFQEKSKKMEGNYLVGGFPPLIVEDFQVGDFGWEVVR